MSNQQTDEQRKIEQEQCEPALLALQEEEYDKAYSILEPLAKEGNLTAMTDLGGSLFSLHCDYRGQSGPEITEVDIYEDRVCWIKAFKDQGYLLVPEIFTGDLISHTDEELLALYERRV